MLKVVYIDDNAETDDLPSNVIVVALPHESNGISQVISA